MLAYILPLSIFLFHQGATQITLCTGTWSAWVPDTVATCVDPEGGSPCGMCGQIQAKRTCQTPLCPCQGATNTTTAPCGEVVCIYPKPACCPPYAKKLIPGGGVICAPLP